MGVIYFNGRSSLDYGIQVEHPPKYVIPQRDYEVTHVPGRNGDIVVDNGSYQNVDRPYDISMGSEREHGFNDFSMRLAEWLGDTSGYGILMDSYEPFTYRIAMYSSNEEYENIFDQALRGTVTFNCKPQRFLLSGEDAVTISAASELMNPTVFTSKPIVKVYGSGYTTVHIGAYEFLVDFVNKNPLNAFTGANLLGFEVNGQTYVDWLYSKSVSLQSVTFTCSSINVTASASDSSRLTVSVTGSTFLTKIGTKASQNYRFTYDGENWLFDNEIITLSQYGISVTSSNDILSGDYVTISVKDYWSASSISQTSLTLSAIGINYSGIADTGYTITVCPLNGAVEIDSDARDVVDAATELINMRSNVEFQNGFPLLVKGSNSISWSTNRSSNVHLEVIPKWWNL